MVSEVLAEFPEMQSQNFKVLLTHTNLLPTVLKHCGITADMKRDIFPILHSLIVSLRTQMCYIIDILIITNHYHFLKFLILVYRHMCDYLYENNGQFVILMSFGRVFTVIL